MIRLVVRMAELPQLYGLIDPLRQPQLLHHPADRADTFTTIAFIVGKHLPNTTSTKNRAASVDATASASLRSIFSF